MDKKQAVLSLSGGMDSSTLLLHLLAKGYEVTALSFDYGQKHSLELQKAKELVEYLNSRAQKVKQDKNGDVTVVKEYFSPVAHQVITIDGITELLNSALVEGGEEVPEGHYEEENMKDTVVPNRNKIFSSLIQAVALSIATKKDTKCQIAMGIHAGDHAIYPDCRKEFRNADFKAFKLGNWESERVSILTPYLKITKFDILKDGERCCKKLKLDFNEVYKRTNTSYKPVLVWVPCEDAGDLDCAVECSDYKSASSVERIEAFIKLGRPDPVQYADETGLVSWEVAKAHVEKVLSEHQK